MGVPIREGDLRSLKNRAELEGRPLKSNLIRDKEGNLTAYKVKENGTVRIVENDE